MTHRASFSPVLLNPRRLRRSGGLLVWMTSPSCFCIHVELFSLMQDSDCWGSHLNRRAMPGPPPKLTQQDRDGLQASSQYYGLKLKNNLAALRKVGSPPENFILLFVMFVLDK